MDAATLFMILIFPGGGVDTATRAYQNLPECEEAAQRQLSIRDALPPGVTSSAYCVQHIPCASCNSSGPTLG